MSNLRYITPGETLDGYPADAHNAFFSAYKRVFGDPAGKLGTGQCSGSGQLTVEVVNKSGAAIDQKFPILELTKPLFTFTDSDQAIYRGFVFEGDTPADSAAIGNIAVIQGPIGDDNGARIGVLQGPTWCQVDVTDASHTHAAPAVGDNVKFASGTSGAPMIWKESGTGTKFALVLLGGGGGGGSAGVAYRVAKVTAEIAAADDDLPENWGTGTGQPYDFNLGYVDEGADPITLHNMLPFPILENAWVRYDIVYAGGAIAAYVNLVANATCYEYPWHVEA